MVGQLQHPLPSRASENEIRDWLSQVCNYLDKTELLELVNGVFTLRSLSDNLPGPNPNEILTNEDFKRGLLIVNILAELGSTKDVLLAGLLYSLAHSQILEASTINDSFGADIKGLVAGVLRMTAVSEYGRSGDEPILGQVYTPKDNVRQMLVAMIDDVRIAMIKLAERTVVMRGLKSCSPEVQVLASQEVFDVYAPLADRLGIGHLKWELEDLSFRYSQPDNYHKVARLLDGKRMDRDRYISRVRDELDAMLKNGGLNYEIAGRAKHIFSIWRKMTRKGIDFSQVHDVRAARILVDTINDCYQTLGIVHGIWRSIPGEFDDYIANPKENGYQSLHTSVIGPEGKILEVQIRTYEMHSEAELGVCAHWNYKNGGKSASFANNYDQKLAWLRQVLEWHESENKNLSDRLFSFESAQERVYVFTPKGDVVNLSDGSTPLDFAYHVHTEVGHRCRGAKVNGKVVPLNYPLQTGERVEILTSSGARPRRAWLETSSGWLRSPRARDAVHQWFRVQNREDNIAAGRSMIERECSRLALTSVDYRSLARTVGFSSVEDMYAAAGSGELSSSKILRTAEQIAGKGPKVVLANGQSISRESPIFDGIGNMRVQLAKCCLPAKGDFIEGFLTKSRGVTVHKTDCARLLNLHSNAPDRLIAVSWMGQEQHRFEVNIEIHAVDRRGLLADISSVMSDYEVNVTAINTQSDRSDNTAEMRVCADVLSLTSLGEVLSALLRLDNVVSASRILK